MARHILVGIVMFGLVLGFVGCAKVTKSNYDKVKEGMMIDQVKSILGEGEKAGAGISVGGVSVTGDAYKWKDGDKEITVVFKDGKMVTKACKGL